uniref:Uncharacterized protein n=1 Tax=Mustela putorius furo TaxID=9669 RepID=M3YPK0_MUSPF
PGREGRLWGLLGGAAGDWHQHPPTARGPWLQVPLLPLLFLGPSSSGLPQRFKVSPRSPPSPVSAEGGQQTGSAVAQEGGPVSAEGGQQTGSAVAQEGGPVSAEGGQQTGSAVAQEGGSSIFLLPPPQAKSVGRLPPAHCPSSPGGGRSFTAGVLAPARPRSPCIPFPSCALNVFPSLFPKPASWALSLLLPVFRRELCTRVPPNPATPPSLVLSKSASGLAHPKCT